jgi:hypothetical protein
MTTRLCIALLLCLASCAAPSPPPAAPVPPVALQVCPDGTPAPVAPKPPRTMKQVNDWTVELYAALVRTEKARAECAARLAQLNSWIAAQTAAVKPQ